jgi:hypothetical protein
MNKIIIDTDVLKIISFFIIILLLLTIGIYMIYIISNNKKKTIYESLYYNEYCIIKNKESKECKNFLIQRLKDTTQYCEINQNNISLYEDNKYWSSLYYNKNINDTIYFKYIRKNRFFKILKHK